jgi:hypothetical protein
MKHKVTTILALLSILITTNAIVRPSYAISWSPDMRITWNTETDWMPSIIQASDGKIWVVWHSYRMGNADLFYKIYDASQVPQWSVETRLTSNSTDDRSPSIMQASDGKIWVVWERGMDIYYKTSVDNGATWSPETPLVYSLVQDDYDPSVLQASNGTIWVVWERRMSIYYKTSVDNGATWSENTPLIDTGYTEWHPTVMETSDNFIWVVWDSDRVFEQSDIYCKIYDGATWSADTRLTFDSATDVAPSITQTTEGTIWIVWASWRIENLDIYYMTNSVPQHLHDIAIFSVAHDPDVAVVYKGLNVSIEVVPQNQGMEDEFIQVYCYANFTLIDDKIFHLSAGQLAPINFTWNTLNVNPDNYSIIVVIQIIGQTDTDPADNTIFNGAFEVRIPGDADFSGLVEMDDFVFWAENVGKTSDQLSISAYSDFDNNGYVELADFYRWRENIGNHYP